MSHRNELRVGVIGVGKMGFRHMNAYLSNPNVELSYIVDTNIERVIEYAWKNGVPFESSYEKIVDSVDAVSIVTPTHTHYSIAKYFLSKGKHVLLEKPMSENIKQAVELTNLAIQTNSTFAIGHIERFNPVIEYVFNILKERKPLFINIHREGPFDPRIFDCDVIADLMVHDIDLILHILNEEVNVCSAYGIQYYTNKSDLGNVQLISKSGILINITSSRASESKSRNWRMVFPDLYIDIDLKNYRVVSTEKSNKKRTTLETIFNPRKNLLQLEINDFVNSIHCKSRPKTDGIEGVNVVKLIAEIQDLISKKSALRPQDILSSV